MSILHISKAGILFFLLCLVSLTEVVYPRLQLQNADSSAFRSDEKGTIAEFFGNVVFERDSSRLSADYVRWREEQGILFLRGNVLVIEPTRTMQADSLYYFQKKGLANFFGKAKIIEYISDSDSIEAGSTNLDSLIIDEDIIYRERTRLLEADTIYYNEKEAVADAYGNVIIIEYQRHVRIDGGVARFDDKNEFLHITSQPRLILDFDSPFTQTVILADTIIFQIPDDKVIAIDSVRIKQGVLSAFADNAILYNEDERIILEGNCRATHLNDSLSGNNMEVFSENKKLQEIYLSGKGTTIHRQLASPDTNLYNVSKLNADKIHFFFKDELLDLIKAQGNSYSYYTPAQLDSVPKGINQASGDSTIIYFNNSRLVQVDVITSAEGRYVTPQAFDSLGNISKADTIIYHANRIKFLIEQEQFNLEKAAHIEQTNIKLDANKIRYDLKNKLLYAYGFYDSTLSEYSPLVLRDGQEEIKGEQLAYNLEEKRGKIKKSKTKMEKAYYSGEILRKQEDESFLVEGGVYTTCDLDQPHFHFKSHNMKLMPGNKIIARPIVLYIETLPVFALPYYIISTKKGRQSGLLPMQFEFFNPGSRFVRNLGYYWALSDYYDLKTWLDISETNTTSNAGLKFNASTRYHLRYKLRGSLSGSYTRETEFQGFDRGKRTRWQFAFTHDQTIDPTLTIKGSGNFVSDASYFTDFSTDINERLNRNITSSLSLNKRWENASLSLVTTQTKNLDNESHSERLPQITFSKPSKPLFGQQDKKKLKRWFNNIYLSYNSAFHNITSKSLDSQQEATRKKYVVYDHKIRMSAPQKVAGVLTISPSLNLNDTWYYLPDSDQAFGRELMINELKSRQSLSSSISLRTDLYGTIAPNILGLTGLRHVMSPSASINYSPEFTRNNDYSSFTGYGGSGSERKNISFSLTNQFQAKYRKGEKDIKKTLMNLDFRSSYDFIRDEGKLADITTSLRTRALGRLSLQLNMRHDPYNEIGDLSWWNPYLKSITISSGFSGSFNLPKNKFEVTKEEIPSLKSGNLQKQKSNKLTYRISQAYSESRSFGVTNSISHWIDISMELPLTKNWQIKYSQRYDMRRKESANKAIEIFRDLHCWEARFTWRPDGVARGFYFMINVKLLPALKFEKSESNLRDNLLPLGTLGF